MSDEREERGNGAGADEHAERQRRLAALSALAAQPPQVATRATENNAARATQADDGASASPVTTTGRTSGRGLQYDRGASVRRRIVMSVVLVVLVLALGGVVAWHFQAPRPVSTSEPARTVGVLSNVTFGTLTVNGQKIAGQLPALVHFRIGTNSVTLSAPPFGAHTCTFAFPHMSSTNAACMAESSSPPMLIEGQPATDGEVVINFDGSDLPPAQLSSADAAIVQALNAIQLGTRVPAGDYIAAGTTASGGIQSRRTTQPLQALLVPTLGLAQPSGPRNPECGPELCSGQPFRPDANEFGAGATPDGSLWSVYVRLGGRWRFASADGAAVALSPTLALPDFNLTLAYDPATGAWSLYGPESPAPGASGGSLADAISGSLCDVGIDALTRLFPPTPLGQQGPGLGEDTIHPIEGCSLTLLNQRGQDTAHFVWRFGVLLAADAPAHQLFPALPVAPADEISAVTPAS